MLGVIWHFSRKRKPDVTDITDFRVFNSDSGMGGLGFDRYNHTDTDMVWVNHTDTYTDTDMVLLNHIHTDTDIERKNLF